MEKHISRFLKPKNYSMITLVVCGIAATGFLLTAYSFDNVDNVLGAAGLIALQSFFLYLGYTGMHEGAHGNISRQKALNNSVGSLCSFMFFGQFAAFRQMHLEHHKYTNDPLSDPDFWSGQSFPVLRAMTQDIYYYVRLIRDFEAFDNKRMFYIELAITGLLVGGFVFAFGWLNFLLIWLLPSRMAVFAVAYLFNTLPHHPESECYKSQKVQGNIKRPAYNTRLPFAVSFNLIMMFQSYHIVHHLYPNIAFYDMAKAWEAIVEDEFLVGV